MLMKGTPHTRTPHTCTHSHSLLSPHTLTHPGAPHTHTGKTHALLRVIIKGQDQASLDCNDGPISFVYSQVELDRAPYLTLHSYDHRIENIDYTAILKKLEMERVVYVSFIMIAAKWCTSVLERNLLMVPLRIHVDLLAGCHIYKGGGRISPLSPPPKICVHVLVV